MRGAFAEICLAEQAVRFGQILSSALGYSLASLSIQGSTQQCENELLSLSEMLSFQSKAAIVMLVLHLGVCTNPFNLFVQVTSKLLFYLKMLAP